MIEALNKPFDLQLYMRGKLIEDIELALKEYLECSTLYYFYQPRRRHGTFIWCAGDLLPVINKIQKTNRKRNIDSLFVTNARTKGIVTKHRAVYTDALKREDEAYDRMYLYGCYNDTPFYDHREYMRLYKEHKALYNEVEMIQRRKGIYYCLAFFDKLGKVEKRSDNLFKELYKLCLQKGV